MVAEQGTFAQLAQLDSGFIADSTIPLLTSVSMTDYQTVLSSRPRILYQQIDGNTVAYAVAGQAQDYKTLLLRRLFGW